jgi:hypothetical protein
MGLVDINYIQKHNNKIAKTEIKIPKCWVCEDSGSILYNKKVNGYDYEFIAHCTCEAGNKYKYDGIKNNEKSLYYVESISDIVDAEILAKKNISKFIEKHKDDKDAIEELKKHGIIK